MESEKKRLSFPKEKIKVLLLEKIHPEAAVAFEEAGYVAQVLPNAFGDDELIRALQDTHIIGVRSRTQIRAKHFEHARRLLAIGCFSVGTDQVDLDAATTAGVAVFNAPHSSTRSVAELALGNILALARRLGDKSARMHQGRWQKSVAGAVEVRDKTLGIVGYGHIGQQIGLLGEALGMNVLFYDVVKKLPLGRARAVDDMSDLLRVADFVSLHVPGGDVTRNLIAAAELQQMKAGSFLLNLSRGSVVDLTALAASLRSGHLAGAAVDVFPEEPAAGDAPFEHELCSLENVILTPHIGGSTEEAQRNIGREVARSLIEYLDVGSTEGAVNFPQVHLPLFPKSHRLLYVHQNIPGALSEVTKVIFDLGANIDSQYLGTYRDVGYLIMDINNELSEEVHAKISVLPKAIRTRILY